MKKVAVIQDMSSFGKCSLTAAIPVLSVMGIQACPLPTAVLTAQTAYPSFYCKDLTDEMNHFTTQWSKMRESFDGIQTGFVTGKEQIDNIFQFLDVFQTNETLLLVDPVMGDVGELYKMYTSALLERMKELVKRANILTPNITECCLLTNSNYEKLYSYSDAKSFIQALEAMGQKLQQETNAQVIITGIHTPTNEPSEQYIGNLLIDSEKTFFSKQPYNGQSYSGTGDLFSAIIMGSVLRGQSLKAAIQLAESFISSAIHDTALHNTDQKAGVNFEKFLNMLF